MDLSTHRVTSRVFWLQVFGIKLLRLYQRDCNPLTTWCREKMLQFNHRKVIRKMVVNKRTISFMPRAWRMSSHIVYGFPRDRNQIASLGGASCTPCEY